MFNVEYMYTIHFDSSPRLDVFFIICLLDGSFPRCITFVHLLLPCVVLKAALAAQVNK